MSSTLPSKSSTLSKLGLAPTPDFMPEAPVPAAVLAQQRALLGDSDKSDDQEQALDVPEIAHSKKISVRVPEAESGLLHSVQFKLMLKSDEVGMFTGCNLTFLAKSVSIDDNCISIAFSDGFSFYPSNIVELVVIYRDVEYSVTWLGASFKFADRGLCGISFLRKADNG